MTQKHTHKYQKTVLGKNGYTIMKCMLPGCPHFIAQELAAGRLCVCWHCGGDFPLSPSEALKLKPLCDNCAPERAEKYKKETPDLTDAEIEHLLNRSGK